MLKHFCFAYQICKDFKNTIFGIDKGEESKNALSVLMRI